MTSGRSMAEVLRGVTPHMSPAGYPNGDKSTERGLALTSKHRMDGGVVVYVWETTEELLAGTGAAA